MFFLGLKVCTGFFLYVQRSYWGTAEKKQFKPHTRTSDNPDCHFESKAKTFESSRFPCSSRSSIVICITLAFYAGMWVEKICMKWQPFCLGHIMMHSGDPYKHSGGSDAFYISISNSNSTKYNELQKYSTGQRFGYTSSFKWTVRCVQTFDWCYTCTLKSYCMSCCIISTFPW